MISDPEPERISTHVYFVGNQMLCNYVVETGEGLVLLDAGMTISGKILEKQIQYLQKSGRKLKEIWLSHSHYDHLGAVPYLLKKFPGIRTRAHERVARILQNPKAVRLIFELNRESERRFLRHDLPAEEQFSTFGIDRFFTDQEILSFANGVQIHVIFTPGHTRDSVAFYILPDRVLFGGDGLGIPTPTGFIQATFLSDYTDYLHSLEKIAALDIQYLALPHAGVIKGEDAVRRHLQNSMAETRTLRNRIADYLKAADGDIERVTERITDEDYERHQIMQPKEAFLINLRAMVALTYRDLFQT